MLRDESQRESVDALRQVVNDLMVQNREMLTNAAGLESELSDRTRQLAQSAQDVKYYRGLVSALVENADDAIMAKDLDGTVLSCNPASERLFGYSESELVGRPAMLIIPPDKEVEERDKISRIRQGEHVSDYETVRRCKAGHLIAVSVRMSPIRDGAGNIRAASTIIRDITERKKTEQFILNSLHEKDVLLREIHHRVKNNLAVVSSLIYLQSTRATDRAMVGFFQETRNRIRSMALIHETLYSSNNLAEVDFGCYVKALAETLLRTYGTAEKQIELVYEVDSVCLPIEQAIPCGLIVNELLSNAFKHAFHDGRTGVVTMSVRKGDEDQCIIGVGDDGVGVTPTTGISSGHSLGLHLVRTLSQQLDGVFELGNQQQGTQALVRFKIIHDTSKQ